MRSPIQQKSARNRAETGGDQDRGRLSESQLPVLQYEGQNIADQKEVEKVEHIADVCRGDNLPLIGR
jgi:hypothetical protein